MKKKGFTLVELLAVIAILAILVIIALPNVLGMFNQAKKNTFVTEIQSIYSTAETQFISDSMGNMTTFTDGIKYARINDGTLMTDESKGYKKLDLSGTTAINFYIHFSLAGKVTEFYAYSTEFQFIYSGNDLKKEDIAATEIAEGSTLTSVGHNLDASGVVLGTPVTGDAINTGVITIADADSYINGQYYKIKLEEDSATYIKMTNVNAK